jgi:hypothetical protein
LARKSPIRKIERWLSPNLGYEPKSKIADTWWLANRELRRLPRKCRLLAALSQLSCGSCFAVQCNPLISSAPRRLSVSLFFPLLRPAMLWFLRLARSVPQFVVVPSLVALCLCRLKADDGPKPVVPPPSKTAPSGSGPAGSAKPASAGSNPFRTVLADGATIEFLGLCEYPSAGHEWWRPDGSPLGRVPGGQTPKSFERKESLGPLLLEVAIEATLAEGADASFVERNRAVRSTSSVRLGSGKSVTQIIRAVVQLEPNSRMTLNVHYAPEPWKRQGQIRYQGTLPGGQRVRTGGAASAYASPAFGVILAAPMEADGLTRIVSAYDFEDLPHLDVRVIAVGTDKREHSEDHRSQLNARGAHMLITEFVKLPLEGIEKFQFQTRRVQPIAFTNISLHAAKRPISRRNSAKHPWLQIQFPLAEPDGPFPAAPRRDLSKMRVLARVDSTRPHHPRPGRKLRRVEEHARPGNRTLAEPEPGLQTEVN